MPTDSPFLFLLPCHDSLDRTQDLDLLIYISNISPLTSYDFLSWTELEDIDLLIYIWCFLFQRTIPFPILLLIVWSYSDPSTYDNLGTFLVHLAIVLSLRKALIGLVYKPAHSPLFSLASSMHHLHSNLVSSLGIPVWLKPNQLLVTRSPSKKTSLDLSLNLGLTDLSFSCHCPRIR